MHWHKFKNLQSQNEWILYYRAILGKFDFRKHPNVLLRCDHFRILKMAYACVKPFHMFHLFMSLTLSVHLPTPSQSTNYLSYTTFH